MGMMSRPLQLGERQIGEVPVILALAEEGAMQRRAVAQEADIQILEKVEVALPLVVVAALLHLVPRTRPSWIVG